MKTDDPADVVLDVLNDRKGFDAWWGRIDDEIQEDIKEELRDELDVYLQGL